MTKRSATEDTYEGFLDMIVTGRFRPGEHVVEDEVAERLGVSRTPVRHAMQALVVQGLLRKENHRGCFVAKAEPEELCEIFQAREAIEGMAARLMAEQADEEDVAELRDICQAFSAAMSEEAVPRCITLANRFHRRVIRGCGNQYIAYHMNAEALLLKAAINLRAGMTLEFWEGQPSHTDILAAIEAHDADRAERVVREHVRYMRETTLRLWGEQADG